MTDVAVSDGGAPAPADTTPVAIVEPAQVDIPNPISAQLPEKPAAEVKPEAKKTDAPKSAGEAIKRAQEAIKAKEAAEAKAKAEPKPEAKPEPAKATPEKDERGRFVAKQPEQTAEQPQVEQLNPNAPHREAPARFSPDAKAAWATAPEPVQAEVHRAIKELEQGHQKYKASHDSWETVREFDEIARKNGGNLKASLEKVSALEDAFLRNPIEGFQKVADHFGLSLRAVAAHIMGQTPDQVQQNHDQTISRLNQQISRLEQQLSGVSQTIHQQQQSAVIEKIQSFAAEHPRFDELSDTITQLLTSKMATTLPEAYEMAERLKPAPSNGFIPPAQPLIPAAAPQPRPVNPAGQKQITGAPANGSNPSPQRKTAAPSIREALKRASAQHR